MNWTSSIGFRPVRQDAKNASVLAFWAKQPSTKSLRQQITNRDIDPDLEFAQSNV